MANTEIRTVAAIELDELLGLYRHLHASDTPLPEREQVEACWREIIANPCLRCFGLFVDHRLVASCTLAIIPNLTRGCRPYGLIENMVTHADFRRNGYGKAVLQHALAFAWQQHCYKVMLLTGRKTEATYAFYEAAGFDRQAKQAFLAKPRG